MPNLTSLSLPWAEKLLENETILRLKKFYRNGPSNNETYIKFVVYRAHDYKTFWV